MSVKATRVSIGTTPVVIADGGRRGAGGDYVSVQILNSSDSTIYVGGVDVDTTDGFPIATTLTFSAELATGDVLYGRTASGTKTVFVIKTRN